MDTNTNNYLEFVRKLEQDYDIVDKAMSDPQVKRLAYGLIGFAGELGEIADVIKRKIFYNINIDKTNIIEEFGDMLFYFILMLDSQDLTINDVQTANVEKLKKRYPDLHFDINRYHRKHRDLTSEKDAIKNCTTNKDQSNET